MYTTILADILAADYEAFRRLMPLNLPDTFNEWRHEMDKREAQTISGGNDFKKIIVKPDEFIRYCTDRAMTCDRHSLNAFAVVLYGRD